MSTPYMSGFHEQIERVSAIARAVVAVPSTGRSRSTASRGMPRIRWTPKRSPIARMRSASGRKPRPPALDGKRFGAGSSRPLASIVGTGRALYS